MNDREKLIELLDEGLDRINRGTLDFMLEILADHLLANGVVVREKGEWRIMDDGFDMFYYCPFCSEISTFADNFCPNCGADMRKGENE